MRGKEKKCKNKFVDLPVTRTGRQQDKREVRHLASTRTGSRIKVMTR